MKKILLVISTLLCFGIAVAQTNPLDNQLKNVNQAAVTSGIIYDRATPLADLTIFNIPAEKPHNTANFRFFRQALSELHKATEENLFVKANQLKASINPKTRAIMDSS